MNDAVNHKITAPNRIEICAGYYFEGSGNFNGYFRLMLNGEQVRCGHFERGAAQAFAAAMNRPAPQQAPVRSAEVQHVLNRLVLIAQDKPTTNYEVSTAEMGVIMVYIATLEAQPPAHSPVNTAQPATFVEYAEMCGIILFKMKREGVSFRQLEEITGVDHATSQRCLKKQKPTDPNGFLKLCQWAGYGLLPAALTQPVPDEADMRAAYHIAQRLSQPDIAAALEITEDGEVRLLAQAYLAQCPTNAQPVNTGPSAKDEEQLINERDYAAEQADKLTEVIERLLGQEFGEHSSANEPWQNALDAADEHFASAPSGGADLKINEKTDV